MHSYNNTSISQSIILYIKRISMSGNSNFRIIFGAKQTNNVCHLLWSWHWNCLKHPYLPFAFLLWQGIGSVIDEFKSRTYTYRKFRIDRKSTRLNSSHVKRSRMPSSAWKKKKKKKRIKRKKKQRSRNKTKKHI